MDTSSAGTGELFPGSLRGLRDITGREYHGLLVWELHCGYVRSLDGGILNLYPSSILCLLICFDYPCRSFLFGFSLSGARWERLYSFSATVYVDDDTIASGASSRLYAADQGDIISHDLGKRDDN